MGSAVAVLLESLPPNSPARVLAETVDEDHQIALPVSDVTWLYQHEDPSGATYSSTQCVRPRWTRLTWSPGAPASRASRPGSERHLRLERSMRAANVHMTGYWRQTR